MNVVGTSYFDTWANYQVGYDLISQSVANNTSLVRFYGVLNVTGNQISWGWASASVWGASNGLAGQYFNGSHVVVQQDVTIDHKPDGTYSGTLSGTLSSSWTGGTASGTFTLPKINRIAVVSAVSDFNDETNPTITFTNPAGFTMNAFMRVGNTDIAVASDIPSIGTYTFSLTDAQRDDLRQLCTGQTLSVRVGLRTYNSGGTLLGSSYKDKTMTLVNASPTFTPTYEDTNATTLAITQDDQQIIRNNSTLVINIANADAKKHATLTTLTAEINGTTYNGILNGTTGTISIGTLNLSSNTEAMVRLVDSRGLGTGIPINIEILDWTIPTAIITLGRQNNFYSETDINADASYSSLDNKNTITIKVRSKKTTESTYGAYTDLQDNVQTTLILDNNYQWDVQVLVQDKIGSSTYNLSIDRGIPIVFFDRLLRSMGIDCFPVNGTSLEVNGIDIIQELAKKMNSYDLETDGAEVKTGRTIDSKDEYVKRYSIDNIGTAGVYTKSLGFTLSDVTITKLDGVAYSNSNNWFPISIGDFGGSTNYANLVFLRDSDDSIILQTATPNFQIAHIEIRYFYNS